MTALADTDANPIALDLIMGAAEKHDIVASEDIFDDRGVKLWSSGQTISRSLQQRLLERKLQRPLESCLRAQDGVSIIDLLDDTDAFFSNDQDALARALKPQALAIAHEIPQMQLHPVAQLLLTAVRTSGSAAYAHAVRGMVLAGALAVAAGRPEDTYFLRLALTGGLLHDIGEMYVDPQYLRATHTLGIEQYRHVVAHPQIGQRLLASQTDYPPELARAIGEHHERLDGSGYPAQRQADAVSPLGQLLAVMETTLGICHSAETPLARASFAMRVIPGEFALRWVGPVVSAAQAAAEDLGAGAADSAAVEDLDRRLDDCRARAAAIGSRSSDETVRRICAKAHHLLGRLRAGWNAVGMWSAGGEDLGPAEGFEQRMAARELAWRMRYVQRECLWPVRDLSAAGAEALQPLWDALAPAETPKAESKVAAAVA